MMSKTSRLPRIQILAAILAVLTTVWAISCVPPGSSAASAGLAKKVAALEQNYAAMKSTLVVFGDRLVVLESAAKPGAVVDQSAAIRELQNQQKTINASIESWPGTITELRASIAKLSAAPPATPVPSAATKPTPPSPVVATPMPSTDPVVADLKKQVAALSDQVAQLKVLAARVDALEASPRTFLDASLVKQQLRTEVNDDFKQLLNQYFAALTSQIDALGKRVSALETTK